MIDRRARREQCRILADRLIVEYAGAVPPGQVLATVFLTHHGLARHASLSIAARMTLCESAVRRALTDRLAGQRSPLLVG